MNEPGNLAYPGEFDVLRTKAESGVWNAGTLVVTNYRVVWTPSRFSKGTGFAFDLDQVESVRLVRTLTYAFLVPSVRFRLKNGAVYEVGRMQEDPHRVRHVVEDYRRRERYRPGSLFGESS